MNYKLFRTPPIQLSEVLFGTPDHIGKDVQLLKVGKFLHDGEEIEITKKDLESMVKNFSEGVRGIDLMLDYKHDSEGEAAAWFANVYLSENDSELWASVDWTPDGEDSIRKKKFRYISADFHFNYKDNETLAEHGPTLFGAALTNRPVIKKMTPTILSENNFSKDNEMTPEEMKTKLAEKDTEIANAKKELEDFKKKDKEDKQLAEKKDKEAKALAEKKTAEEKVLSEKKTDFDKKLSEGNVCEAQRDAFMKDDMTEFIKNQAKVNLSEDGHGGSGDDNNDDKNNNSETPAQDEITKLAETKVKEDKISLSEATSRVLSENKELAEKYSKEVEV